MHQTMIRFNQVDKQFGAVRVLNGVSFEVAAGQAVALWGSNGAGKTTLLRCLLGLLRFRGQITVAGLDVRQQGKAARRLIGYVPQEIAFYDDYRVTEALKLVARLRRVGKLDVPARLSACGLAEHGRKRIRELSGGMKQRLGLALALMDDPPILILDEPTSNLDAQGRADMLEQLASLKRQGKTILFISHRPEEIAGLADRVMTLEHGRVSRDDATEPAPTDRRAPTPVRGVLLGEVNGHKTIEVTP